MEDASFTKAWILGDNGHHEEAIKVCFKYVHFDIHFQLFYIQMLTNLIEKHNDKTDNDVIIVNYKARAEWHYFLQNYRGELSSDLPKNINTFVLF